MTGLLVDIEKAIKSKSIGTLLNLVQEEATIQAIINKLQFLIVGKTYF